MMHLSKESLIQLIEDGVADYFNSNEVDVPEEYDDEIELAGALVETLKKDVNKFLK